MSFAVPMNYSAGQRDQGNIMESVLTILEF